MGLTPPIPIPADWPNADASTVVEAAGLRWHVQRRLRRPPLDQRAHAPNGSVEDGGAQARGGPRPCVLLVHGTGGATHAWHRILPRLAAHADVVAPDLPGHGFTEAPPTARLTLPGMAGDLAALLRALDARPTLVVGHSAGAAILLRMALDGALPDARLLVGLNAAIVPPPAVYRALAGPRLRGLFLGPRVAAWGARWAGRAGVTEGMLRSTGSNVPAEIVACYERLAADPRHVRSALAMMAQWDVPALLRDVHRLRLPKHFLHGAIDRWVPAAHAARVAAHIPGARVDVLRGHGHLMHEEAGDELADLLLQAGEEAGALERGPVAVDARHGAAAHRA